MKLEPQSSPAHSSCASEGVESLREHILLRPENYVGSVEKRTQKLWVYESRSVSMAHRLVTYVPGLYKIFDEILLFAADNKQRDPSMNFLNVVVDAAKRDISVYHNGRGIPIDVDRKEGVYMPEMIFGHLSNRDHNAEEEITGLKLANIFSTEFVVEIVDSCCEKKYKQFFSENMAKKSEPQITVCLQGVNWTRVTFKPDLAKFNMTHLDDDALAIMCSRVFDVAARLGTTTVQVAFNGRKLPPLKSFQECVYYYVKAPSKVAGQELPRIYERVNDQWEVCVSLSEGSFQQVSFVNKIATTAGGTHVDYVSNKISARVTKYLNENLPDYNIKEHEVKRYLWVFISAVIEDPTFDTLTKDALTTPQERFGSWCELSDQFVERVADCGLIFKLLSGRHGEKTGASEK